MIHVTHRRGRMAALAALLGLGASARGADVPLGFTFGPAETITYDSNVLRTPSDAASPGGRGDISTATDLTGALHEIYGREDVTASATVGRVLYRHMTQLDYTEQDARARVKASLPLNIDADVSGSHTATLAHFADIATPIRNVITHNEVAASLGLPITLDWRTVVGGNGAQSRNSAPAFATQDFNTAEVNGGIRFQPSTGNHVDLLVRSIHATYISATPQTLLGPGYHDRAADITVDWTFAGASYLHGRAGYLRRTGDLAVYADPVNGTQTLDRNFAGPAVDMTYLWQTTAATKVTLYAERNTGATGDNSYLSAVNHAYRITPGYQPSVKLDLGAYVEYAQSSYFGNVLQAIALTPAAAAALGIVSGASRNDHTRSGGLLAKWSPRRWLEVNADLHRELRTSTVSVFQYVDTFASIRFIGSF